MLNPNQELRQSDQVLTEVPVDSNRDTQTEPLTEQQPQPETQTLPTPARPATWLWQPGQSGNPRGRPPKGKSYRELAESRPEAKKLAVIQAMEDAAIQDKRVAAAEFLRDTAEGRPKQSVEVSQGIGEELRLAFLEQLTSGQVVDGESRLLDS